MSNAFWIGLGGALVAERMKSRKHQREEELMRLAREAAVTPSPLPIAATVESDVRFTASGLFSFGLPTNFVQPDPESLGIWQSASNTRILIAAEDGRPGLANMFLAVYDGSDWRGDLGAHSVWLIAAFADEFRTRSAQRGHRIIQGPTAILIGGEKGVFWVGAENEEGIEVHKWTVQMMHRGTAFTTIMHLRNDADAAYSAAFWTAISSWQWADGPVPGAAPPQAMPQYTSLPAPSVSGPPGTAETSGQTVAPWTSSGAQVSNDGLWWRSPRQPTWTRLPYSDEHGNSWNGVAWVRSETQDNANPPPPPPAP